MTFEIVEKNRKSFVKFHLFGKSLGCDLSRFSKLLDFSKSCLHESSAQLGELVHSDAIEHTPEHNVVCGSEPAGEKHEEGETAAEQQPPRASGYEAATSSRG
jgi:hypothetical protein